MHSAFRGDSECLVLLCTVLVVFQSKCATFPFTSTTQSSRDGIGKRSIERAVETTGTIATSKRKQQEQTTIYGTYRIIVSTTRTVLVTV